LASAHLEAAAQFSEAAHHHRAAALEFARGNKEEAKTHAVTAEAHATFGTEAREQTMSKLNDYDLGVNYDVKQLEPAPLLRATAGCTFCCPSRPLGREPPR
jgi:hypothetical protein